MMAVFFYKKGGTEARPLQAHHQACRTVRFLLTAH